MQARQGIHNQLLLIVACAVTVLFAVGCSTMDKVIAFLSPSRADKAQTDPAYSKAEKFLSNVRPARGNPNSHYLLGRYYFEREMWAEALVEFKKAAAIKPDFAQAYNGIGACHDHLQQFVQARDAYLAALRIDPTAAYVHNNLGYSYCMEKQYAVAVEQFKKAIALEQGNRRFHANLAIAYMGAEQYGLAAKEFELGGHGEMARQYAGRAEQPVNVENRYASEDALPPSLRTLHPAKDIAIEICNGNGVSSMARHIGAYLKEKGFNVVRYTNADRYDHATTQVYFQKEGLETTLALQGEIPEIREMKEVAKLDRPRLKVKMVMGKDLVHYKEKLAQGRY